MNKQGLKNLIIFMIIVLFIIAILMITIKIYLNINENNYMENTPQGENILDTYGKNFSGGVDYTAYFDIKQYMQKYLNTLNVKDSQYGYYNEDGDYVSTSNEQEIKQKIYNLLSNKYITEKNITVENIYDHIRVFQKENIFVPIEMALIQDGNIKSFLVYGLIESGQDYDVIDKLFAIINIDLIGLGFSIEPVEGDYNSINEINIDKFENTIISNEDNKYNESYVAAEDIPVEYINIYKGLALGAPEKLYDLLDVEYRDAKFGNLDEFKKYIQDNKAEIIKTQLEKYQIQVDGTEVRYVCIDKSGNYYIINQIEALSDYTMMLDIYTIDIAEFITKYETSENNVKMALNIEKLIEATKYGDYKYVYNKLNETFKTSNFKTQDDFQKYIEAKYDPEKDTITYEDYEENAGVHVYNIQITKGAENKTINAKIVMKLKENRDFEFSFSVEN